MGDEQRRRKRQYRSYVRCVDPPVNERTRRRWMRAERERTASADLCGNLRAAGDLNLANQRENLDVHDDLQTFMEDDSIGREQQNESEHSADMEDGSDGSDSDHSFPSSLTMDSDLYSDESDHAFHSDQEQESGSEEADQQYDQKWNAPLIENLQTSKIDALLMIITYALRHNLTSVAVSDLCKLVNSLFRENVIPESSYMIKKIFNSGIHVKYHYYCSQCIVYLKEKSDIPSTVKSLECHVCGALVIIDQTDKAPFFVTLPVKEQIIDILETVEDMSEILKRIKENLVPDDKIEDIYHGTLYKNLSQPGNVLADLRNVSLTLNTDGAQVFDSLKNTTWPIQFRLNELPPHMRFKQNNSGLCGLWFGKHEPDMTLFLTPFVKEMLQLQSDGLMWKNSDGHFQNSKVVVINAVFDSRAKPLVQNVKFFNGYNGCGYCNHPGVVLQEASSQVKDVVDGDEALLLSDCSLRYNVTKQNRNTDNSTTHVVTDRSDEDIRADMRAVEAIRTETGTGRPADINGVKGISLLYVFNHFDMVFGFAIDYLHAVLLGVTRTVTSLWLETTSSNEPYYIGSRIADINKKLLKITPPTSIRRRTRTILDRAVWKGNEWRSWLLFYSLPCLVNILPNAYLRHHCLLVSAVFVMLSELIDLKDLEEATWHLWLYASEYQELYGRANMFYNVHLLLHLGKCVRRWGPLWCYSAFSFESGNGCLVRLVKGTVGVAS